MQKRTHGEPQSRVADPTLREKMPTKAELVRGASFSVDMNFEICLFFYKEATNQFGSVSGFVPRRNAADNFARSNVFRNTIKTLGDSTVLSKIPSACKDTFDATKLDAH